MKNGRVKKYISRTLEEKIRSFLPSPEIIAVLGARQVGKTTLLQKVYADLPEPKVFLDFEDQEIRVLFDEDIKGFAKRYVDPHELIFIDEFQYSNEGGKSLKYLYDHHHKKFVISGSSSLDISLKAVSFLVGRVFAFELYPLSFREFLAFREEGLLTLLESSIRSGDRMHESLHAKLMELLEEFSLWGGYPRVATAERIAEKKEILKNIFTTYLLKDIRGFFRLATESNMQKLVRAVALQVGNLIRYNELSALSGLGQHALKNHLAILEETYVLKLLKPFYTNKRLEITKNPKAYFMDTGLRNYVCRDFRPLDGRTDQGQLLENFVATEFVKEGLEFNYWRSKSKSEVDFIVQAPGGVIPVEVKASREDKPGRSFFSFIRKYDPPLAYLLYGGKSGRRQHAGKEIRFLPLYAAHLMDFSS